MSEFKYDIESDMFTCYFLYNKKLYFLLCKKDCTDKKTERNLKFSLTDGKEGDIIRSIQEQSWRIGIMKFKKVVSAVLVSALAVSMMAGCGSKSGSSDSKSDVFKIGGIGPMTGDAAAYGEAVDNGAKLAVEEINKNGGINGKQVEFKTEDDQADAEKAVNAYNTLKDWGMQILMGTVTSGSCTAVASETDSDHMFQITPSGTAVESVQDHDNVFRLCFSDPEQGTKSAEYIAKNKLATKIAVIYNSSDVYSNGIYTNFAAEAKKEGLDVVAAEAFTADNKTDFSVQLKKAQSSGADLCIPSNLLSGSICYLTAGS